MPNADERRLRSRNRPQGVMASLGDSELTSQAQRDRRLRILHAAAAIANEGGYDDVIMRTVARRAAVSLGTLYRYFPSKDHLLVAVFGSWLDRMSDRLVIGHGKSENARARLFYVVDRLNDAVTLDPRLSEAMATAYLSADSSAATDVEKVRKQMSELLAQTIAGSVYTTRRCTEVAAFVADVWATNVLAVVRKRRSAAELRYRMQITIDLLFAGGDDNQGDAARRAFQRKPR